MRAKRDGRRRHAGVVIHGLAARAKVGAARRVIEATCGIASVRRIGDANSRTIGPTFSRRAARSLDGVPETGQRTLSPEISIQ